MQDYKKKKKTCEINNGWIDVTIQLLSTQRSDNVQQMSIHDQQINHLDLKLLNVQKKEREIKQKTSDFRKKNDVIQNKSKEDEVYADNILNEIKSHSLKSWDTTNFIN